MTQYSSDSFLLSQSDIKEIGFLKSIENLADFVKRQKRKVKYLINKDKK